MLTDRQCKNAECPPGKALAKLADANSLYLQVESNGSRRWFWKYRLAGVEKRLAIGSYPEVSLAQARLDRDAARLVLKSGQDPVLKRQLERARHAVAGEDTYEAVAREYHATRAGALSPRYSKRWLERSAKDLFPYIGKLSLSEITAPVLLKTLRRVEARSIECAHNLKQYTGQVFRHGIATGRCERNPAADLTGALKPVIVEHQPSISDPKAIGELMRGIANYHGQPVTKAALVLSALTFQRPGNIRTAEWSEIDLDGGMWSIPPAKMKARVQVKKSDPPHLVPLAKQAVAALREIFPLTGHGRYVFPGLANHQRPMSENTVNLALRRIGFAGDELVAHGFRSMARTVLVERTSTPADVIEAQLAHTKSGPLGRAYDRSEFIDQRRKMMQTWADLLDSYAKGADVVKLRKPAQLGTGAE